MTREPDFDETLRRGFQGLKAGDARETPDFALLIARARADAATTPTVPAAHRRMMWSGKRLLLFGAPLAAAATLGIWLRPTNAADREFEQAVSAWSRTAAQTAHSPTDGLLSVPGTEFLRGTPMVGTDGRTPRRGS